jgi:hypothetical protein
MIKRHSTHDVGPLRWSLRSFGGRAALPFVVAAAMGIGVAGCSSSGPPIIQAAVLSFPPGLTPPGHHSAGAVVLDSKDGSPLDNATVTINGTVLSFDGATSQYEGSVELAPGQQVNVSVTLEGKTYAGTAVQFADYPSIVAPVSGEVLHAHVPSTIRWTLGTVSLPVPGAGTQYTMLGVLDAANPDGAFVWPLNARDLYQVNAGEVFRIDDSLSPGSRVLVVGKLGFFGMGGAENYSSLTVGAFAAQPVMVSSGTLSSLTISPTPAQFAAGPGVVGFLTATGQFSDGTIQDLTELVTWELADPSVASVDSLGGLAAGSPGMTTVSATYGNVTISAPLTITGP